MTRQNIRSKAKRRSPIAVAGSRLGLLVWCGLVALPAGAAQADNNEAVRKAAVERGNRVIEEWCRDCHVREDQKLTADMAPAYGVIVAVEGRDRAWFERFLEEDHFPMPIYRLFDHEKADVVEWLMDLQRSSR